MNNRHVTKLNKENIPPWKTLIKFHITSISDASIKFLDNEYLEVIMSPLTTEQLKQRT